MSEEMKKYTPYRVDIEIWNNEEETEFYVRKKEFTNVKDAWDFYNFVKELPIMKKKSILLLEKIEGKPVY